MRIVMFYHSLVSDWNHGNAHFLRGVITELQAVGHDVRVYEPADAWSVRNLVSHHGMAPLDWFHSFYPGLESKRYELATLDLEAALEGADLVLVHEWNDPELVARVGQHRARDGGFRLLFHDTHHRAVTAVHEMYRFDLEHFDGVLAFGSVIRDLYLERGWAARAWTWHEAADVRVFRPWPEIERERDLVWVGNWGDEERTSELREFLIDPVRELGLTGTVHGVRYPESALRLLGDAGLEYRGWIPNYHAPQAFAAHRLTVHVPRRPYARALPGIPTIRVFEALACGIPLISAPWDDTESLFAAGADYLVARDGEELKQHVRTLLAEPEYATALSERGRRTVAQRHTCAHRVDELLAIARELGVGGTARTLAS